tara:strand:- start:4354 stop:4677 length:324 start_codon:yes stop_codon:yes gene_type:complete
MSDTSTPGEFSRTLIVSPTSAQNSISVNNWTSTNNALGNWLTVTQNANDNTVWDFVLNAHGGTTPRQTEVTVTHPENSSITDSFEISQNGSGVMDEDDGDTDDGFSA